MNFFKMSVKCQDGAVVFTGDNRDIAVGKIYCFPFLLQGKRKSPGVKPGIILLADNVKSIEEFSENCKVVFLMRSL